MPSFRAGDVVRVAFPYVETSFREVRPALVVSTLALGPGRDLLWALMITSAANRGWPGDVSIETDHQQFGLPAPSVIRTEKIAVLEMGSASLIGQVSAEIMSEVKAKLADCLGMSAA